MVTINTNLAASAATRNLSTANDAVSSSISKLSSGNRIIKASDDVAGLAIGTSIASTVKTLQIALLNTQQASSVLSIADGALSQVGDILSRQQSIAAQATSGSLGTTERGYLNQEFQALISEVDRIVGSTSFNGITLLDGSVSGSADVKVSDPKNAGVQAPATLAVSTSPTYAAVGTAATTTLLTTGVNTHVTLGSFVDPTNQQTGFGTFSVTSYNDNGAAAAEEAKFQTTINGKVYISNLVTSSATDDTGPVGAQTITFTSTDGTSSFGVVLDQATAAGAIDTAPHAASLATQLTTALANVSVYQVRSATGLNTAGLAGGTLAGAAGTVAITANSFDTTNNDFGTVGKFTVTAGVDTANSISVTINGKTFSASDLGGANDSIAATEPLTLFARDGAGNPTNEKLVITLTGLTAPIDITNAGSAAGLQDALNTLFNVGGSGTAYAAVGTAAGAATAVNVASFNDADFQGKFGAVSVANFSENGSGAETATLSTQLGDKTYTALVTASATGGNVAAGDVTFTANDGSGSSFKVTLAANTSGALDTAASTATYAAAITTSLKDTNIYQIRTVSGTDATAVSGTVLSGISADAVTLKSNAFDTTDGTFGNIGAFAGTAGAGTANKLSVIVNGITFSATDIGGTDDILNASDRSITLKGQDAAGNDNNQTLTIDVTGLTGSINLANQDEVDNLSSALNTYFGAGNGGGGLSFQVGAAVTDKISVAIGSVKTADIYKDNEGVSQKIDVTTQANAQQAIEVLTNAVASVISRRADVGAAQSRFNFAAANLETSISNQDSARGSFLDDDIASESTTFASAQVRLQASTSVLAQANALPRDLLRLLQ